MDLARLAGCAPVGVLSEVVSKADGSMARTPELLGFAKQHKLKCVTIADLVAFRMKNEMLVQLISSQWLHTRHGRCMAHCYRSHIDDTEHMALVSGNVAGKSQVLVTVVTENSLDDLFGAEGSQLDAALKAVCDEAEGVLIYLSGSGKAPAFSEQLSRLSSKSDNGDSSNASPDPLQHGVAASILRDLDVKSMRILSNNDRLPKSMNGSGLAVSESVSLENLHHMSNSNGSHSSSDMSYQESVEASLDQWMPKT